MDCNALMNRTVVLIPARYESSRFPGKPLIDLVGKPMIIWVAELSSEAVGKENVYIATDDDRIAGVISDWEYNVIMTGPALTGTDRIAEAALQVDADIFLNVQGDEALVNPEDILKIKQVKLSNPESVINGFSYLGPNEIPDSVNIPKVIMNERDELVYMSRCALPGFKDKKQAPKGYKKQVCIYAFTKDQLTQFRDFGRKSELEFSEDIEILRYLELGIPVKMIEVGPGTLAVDCPEDVAAVETALKKLHKL